MNYEQRYKKVNLFFYKYPTLLNIFYKLYKYLPLIIAGVYAVLVVYTFFFKNWECTIKVVLVPLVTFISVSVLNRSMEYHPRIAERELIKGRGEKCHAA